MELGIEIKFVFRMEIMFGLVIRECRCESEGSTSISADAGVEANPPALKRFKYLATKLRSGFSITS